MKKEKTIKFRFPILAKTVVLIAISAIVIIIISIGYYAIAITNRNKATYNGFADNFSATLSEIVDVDDFNLVRNKVDTILSSLPKEEIISSDNPDIEKQEEYLANYSHLFEDNEFVFAYERIRTQIRAIEEKITNFSVDCVYVSYVYSYLDENNVMQGYCVYLVDSAPDEEACLPGCVDPLYDINRDVLEDQEKGFPAYTTNTNYGHLVSAGTYIKGTERGYAFVDLSMGKIQIEQFNSIFDMFFYLGLTIFALVLIATPVINFIYLRPIKKLHNVAKQFDNNDPDKSHNLFVELKLKTHDEISELADTIKDMEQGVHERIIELMEVNKELVDAQKETERITIIANKDSLTGVKNKTAYDFEVENINNQIKNKEDISFGIAMFDLNYLKKTNDEFGHTVGDEALIKLANVICLVFAHSPVYRVGGDEFVAILRGSDYDNSESLIDEFKERIEDLINSKSLEDSKKISAAIGYSIYDKNIDTCVDDVFKRADKNMYQHKREMKK